MNDQELEKTLLETLRIAKETREYVTRIDRRQRWSRNWTAFYWAFIVVLALTGYYFAFPYLQVVQETLSGFTTQASALVDLGNTFKK